MGTYVQERVYIGFGTICGFRWPLGDLGGTSSVDKGGWPYLLSLILSPLTVQQASYDT